MIMLIFPLFYVLPDFLFPDNITVKKRRKFTYPINILFIVKQLISNIGCKTTLEHMLICFLTSYAQYNTLQYNILYLTKVT